MSACLRRRRSRFGSLSVLRGCELESTFPKENNVELNFSVDVDDKNDDDDDDEDDATTNDFERHRHCRLDGVEAVATTPDT